MVFVTHLEKGMLCCLTRYYSPRDSLSSGIFLSARIAINHNNYQLRLSPTLLYSYAPITQKVEGTKSRSI